jgi:CBS domain-containing protein/mannitol/fructose-specific phosphotransferase system IIA component (Ntr-type)
MKLSAFVAPDRLLVPLAPGELGEATRALVGLLVRGGFVTDEERLRDRIAERRPEDVVAMGDRAFLVHYRTEAVRDLVVAVGTRPEPVWREVADGERQNARVVLLVLAPPRMAARYLQVLGAFARLFSKTERLEAVLAETTAQGLAALPLLAQFELPEQLAVRDIMTVRPLTVRGDAPLREAAQRMVRSGVGGLPVVEEGERLVGMLSERELMRHLLSSYLQGGGSRSLPAPPTARRTVRDVMTRQVLCVSPEQPLAEVASLMTNKDIDRVPVVKEGRLVGLLTRGDIVRKLIGY